MQIHLSIQFIRPRRQDIILELEQILVMRKQ